MTDYKITVEVYDRDSSDQPWVKAIGMGGLVTAPSFTDALPLIEQDIARQYQEVIKFAGDVDKHKEEPIVTPTVYAQEAAGSMMIVDTADVMLAIEPAKPEPKIVSDDDHPDFHELPITGLSTKDVDDEPAGPPNYVCRVCGKPCSWADWKTGGHVVCLVGV